MFAQPFLGKPCYTKAGDAARVVCLEHKKTSPQAGVARNTAPERRRVEADQ
jgi:hypothetical protein